MNLLLTPFSFSSHYFQLVQNASVVTMQRRAEMSKYGGVSWTCDLLPPRSDIFRALTKNRGTGSAERQAIRPAREVGSDVRC
jgi:hypothetical protein